MELLLFVAITFKKILILVLFFFLETVQSVQFASLYMMGKASGCALNVFLKENLNGGPKAPLNPFTSNHGISKHCLVMATHFRLLLEVIGARYNLAGELIFGRILAYVYV
jgi:hypothetical protein